MTLPAFAAKSRRLQHVVRSYPSISGVDTGAQQQTRRMPLLLSTDGTDERVGRTLGDVTQTLLRILCGERQKCTA